MGLAVMRRGICQRTFTPGIIVLADDSWCIGLLNVMIKFPTVIFLLTALSISALGQKYVVEKSSVSFYSEAAIEDIYAENTRTPGIFNEASGDIAFSIPIKAFQFKKSLMQEHFNEKYLESDKYPKSTFQGKVNGFLNTAAGIQSVKATGKLTIHGVTKEVEIPGTIEFDGGKLTMKTKFIVKLEDYNVKIPQLMWKNIAEQVEVTVDFTFKPQ
ncbi:MAG: YceI family protein [Cyclobacteriaceae bacterium]|nr:YceI family protein [Cyclobacteriaceae bacterium]MDH4295625.1 YceI family protein [Cyclobacteriaceae bacterium]MDH5248971.1 YceI family protein [Cyclobacteriaceae bacterium]